MADVLSLPPELVDNILSYLQPTSQFDSTEGIPVKEYDASKSELLACSLVCRTWRDLALRYLFSDVRVLFSTSDAVDDDRGRTSLANFYAFLSQSPYIGSCIRKLRLELCPIKKVAGAHILQWTTEDYPSHSLLLGILNHDTLPHLTHVQLRDVYLHSQNLDPSITDFVSHLEEVHIACGAIYRVSLLDLSNILSLFTDVDHLHLSGFPAIQSGYDVSRFDGASLRNLRPTCITVGDPESYDPLLLKLSASSAITSLQRLVVGAGAVERRTWPAGMRQLAEAAGSTLQHFGCMHMLQPISYDVIGLASCSRIETLTFYFNLCEDAWWYPNFMRWETIRDFIISFVHKPESLPSLRTIIFSLTSRGKELSFRDSYRPLERELSLIGDVEDAIENLLESRRFTPLTSSDWRCDSPSIDSFRVVILGPEAGIGVSKGSLNCVQEQSFRRLFPKLNDRGILNFHA